MVQPRRRNSDQPTMAEWYSGLRADYDAAKTGRFTRRRSGVSASGSGADFHYRSEAQYLKLMEYARDLDRNDLAIGQTITRAVQNTIQDGFKLDVRTGDEKLDKDLAARWTDWTEDAEQCDVAGDLTFWEMEQIVLRSCFVAGDILPLPIRDSGRDSGALQLVEAHRLRTPTNAKLKRADGSAVIHGVKIDQQRKRQEYWFTRDDISPMQTVSRVGQVEKIPAYGEDGEKQVFHVYDPRRATQTRGITALAPMFTASTIIDDVIFAKLVQAQVCSAFAIFRKRGPSWQGTGQEPEQQGERTTQTRSDGSTWPLEGIGPGLQVFGDPDEELQGFSPNVPNPEFVPFARWILQLIGCNLGMPLVMVLLDAKETNFSGWRGAVDQARLGFRRNQKWLATRFHRPTYHWKVRQWMARDSALRNAAAKDGIKIFGHRFQPSAWPYVDPWKDATADLLRVRNALTSQRRRAAERGMDWGDLSDEICDDNAMLIRKAHVKAQELNTEFPGLDVTWREVASLPTPDGVQVSIMPETEDRAQSRGDAEKE